MPHSLRYSLLSLRDLLISVGPFVVLGASVLWLLYHWLNPVPPKRVTLASGPAQSAYAEFGVRYAKALAVHGIQVDVVPSEGSSQNLAWLAAGKVDVGFVQGGSNTLTADQMAGLTSLGNLFVEPVWLFYRRDSALKVHKSGTLSTLAQLQGLRVNVGTQGSGVPNLMSKLFDINRIDEATLALSRLEQTPAVVAFLNGEIDALVFASSTESPMVRMLLQTPGIQLMDFAQSEAYARRLPFLSAVTLPRGVVDLARDIPSRDVRLIATTTTMVATEQVHPALIQLFSQASIAMHSPADWFNRAREFPQAIHNEFAVSEEAERTIRNGTPWMQRYLPFSYANLLERMWLALGIVIAVLLPLSRVVPPLYAFRIRSKVFRWYGQLRSIEDRSMSQDHAVPELLAELNALDARVGKITIPLSYADELYALRDHIELVRRKLLST